MTHFHDPQMHLFFKFYNTEKRMRLNSRHPFTPTHTQAKKCNTIKIFMMRFSVEKWITMLIALPPMASWLA